MSNEHDLLKEAERRIETGEKPAKVANWLLKETGCRYDGRQRESVSGSQSSFESRLLVNAACSRQ
jgi:hypothetical protein